jgi:hypothetical protein
MCGLRSTEPGDKIVTRPSGGRRGRRPERRASRLKGPRVERERRPSAGRGDLGHAVERLGTARAESARIPRRRCAVRSVCRVLPLQGVLPWPRRLPRSARAPRQPCLLRLDGRRVPRSQATGAAPRPVLVTVSPRGARRDSKRPTVRHHAINAGRLGEAELSTPRVRCIPEALVLPTRRRSASLDEFGDVARAASTVVVTGVGR